MQAHHHFSVAGLRNRDIVDREMLRAADFAQSQGAHQSGHSWTVTMNLMAAGWIKSASVGVFAKNDVLFAPA